MKTLLLCITTFLLLNIATLSAQSVDDFGINHYTKTKTFVMDGYSYQCDVNQASLFINLYNKANKWTYTNDVYKDTGEPFIGNEGSRDPRIVYDPVMIDLAYDIVDNAFTKAEVAQLEKSEIGITMFVNSESGRVDEVCFNTFTFTPYAKVPVRIYRDIEVKLKEKLKFIPMNEGKKLNYIFLAWFQLPKGKAEGTPFSPVIPFDPVVDPNDPGTQPITP